MTESPLARHAGPVALTAGLAMAAIHVVMFALMDDDRVAMLTDPLFQVVNGLYFVAFCGLAVALVSLHSRLGTGVIGFVAALVGTMAMGGDMWFDGFATPWLAEVWPPAFTAERTVTLITGALFSYLSFALGWVLFAVAAMRARAVPVVLGVALAVGGLLGFRAGIPPFGAPIALAVAAVGGWLIHQGRQSAAAPEPTAQPVSRS